MWIKDKWDTIAVLMIALGMILISLTLLILIYASFLVDFLEEEVMLPNC